MERFANVLKGLGVTRGDRVAIYMPMIPELPVAMLACTRIGAAHSVVFGGFSSDALRDRINDAEAKVLVTADGGWRKGRANLLKPAADVALADTPSITDVVVVHRVDEPVDHDRRPGPLVARADGRRPSRTASPSAWTPRTCSTCSTPAGPRPSPRASCTPPAAT